MQGRPSSRVILSDIPKKVSRLGRMEDKRVHAMHHCSVSVAFDLFLTHQPRIV